MPKLSVKNNFWVLWAFQIQIFDSVIYSFHRTFSEKKILKDYKFSLILSRVCIFGTQETMENLLPRCFRSVILTDFHLNSWNPSARTILCEILTVLFQLTCLFKCEIREMTKSRTGITCGPGGSKTTERLLWNKAYMCCPKLIWKILMHWLTICKAFDWVLKSCMKKELGSISRQFIR